MLLNGTVSRRNIELGVKSESCDVRRILLLAGQWSAVVLPVTWTVLNMAVCTLMKLELKAVSHSHHLHLEHIALMKTVHTWKK